EYASHQPPLYLCHSRHEGCSVAAQCSDNWKQQKGVDRNEDQKELIPLDPDQIVLERQHYEESDGEHQVIGPTRWGQRQEFAQRRERSKPEKRYRTSIAEQEGEPEGQQNRPPGLDPTVKVLDDGVATGCLAPLQHDTDHRSDDENGGDADKQGDAL